MSCKVILRRPLFINNRIKPTGPQSFWRPGQRSIKNNDAPIPPAGEVEMRQHLGVRGKAPAGVQRAAPFGARRRGGLPGEGRCLQRRIKPVRGVGGRSVKVLNRQQLPPA